MNNSHHQCYYLQLQERLDDLQTRLQRERDSWKLQETLYNERLKVFQDIQEVYNNCSSFILTIYSLRNLVKIKNARWGCHIFKRNSLLYDWFLAGSSFDTAGRIRCRAAVADREALHSPTAAGSSAGTPSLWLRRHTCSMNWFRYS